MSESNEKYWIYYCRDCRSHIWIKVWRAFGFLWEHSHPQHARCDTCGNPEARYVKSVWH